MWNVNSQLRYLKESISWISAGLLVFAVGGNQLFHNQAMPLGAKVVLAAIVTGGMAVLVATPVSVWIVDLGRFFSLGRNGALGRHKALIYVCGICLLAFAVFDQHIRGLLPA